MPEPAATDITDDAVRDYLKDHGDFFERHPDLLDYLHIAHSSGSAVSLVERQVSVLRERNMEMRKRLNSLTDNARNNDRLYDATRALILRLLDASDLDHLTITFRKAMQDDFQVEHASIILFGDPGITTSECRFETLDSACIEIGPMIKGRKAMCGALRKEELNYLFPLAGEVGSAAVMPLYGSVDLGVIAVGSSDAHYYTTGMGTLFLHHIADVLVRILPRLDTAPV